MDNAKVLYAFCREMKVLPSQVFDEDAILMTDMLRLFEEEMRIKQREIEEMKRRR